MAKAVSRSSTGAGYQDIKSPETLETDALQVNTTMVPPAGAAFPGSPVAGEWFWRTDLGILYRRNSANLAWDPVSTGEKSGTIPKASFVSSGGIRKATVTFGTAYADDNYAISHVVNGAGSGTNAAYIVSVKNKTAAGFDLYVHSGNINDLVAVEWLTRPLGS